MTDREVQILEMLEQGFTYTQIQNALYVSPKVISALKKDIASLGKYSNDATSTEHFLYEPYPPPEVFQLECQEWNLMPASEEYSLDEISGILIQFCSKFS